MQIEGQFVFEGISPDAVWNFLTNPDGIVECLPGCEKLVKTRDNTYEMSLQISIGPIRGSFMGGIRLHDLNPASQYHMSVSGAGAAGYVKGEGRIELTEISTGTELQYAGEVNGGGRIASVGQRMIGGAARMIINQFFRCAAEKLK